MENYYKLLLLCLMIYSPLNVFADLPKNNSPEELERWFNSNEEEWKPQDINEGTLQFLTSTTKIKPHRADNRITISTQSTQDGWVTLEQCHHDLDNLPAAQILYKKQSIRNIRILHSKHIEKAWVEDNSVQMKHISPGSTICVQAELQALARRTDGEYTLTTGPYRRKFLDGYFPVQLTLKIEYPNDLRLIGTQPEAQAGFEITQSRQSVSITSLFEGELKTHFTFKHQSVTNAPL